MDAPEVKAFPTIRAQMGDWFYYITTLPFYEVARRVLPATEFFHPRTLNEWIQRQVIPRRRKEIATYLLNEEERFFNGIVVGLYLGEPKWYGIEVADNNLFGTPGLDPRFRQALDILEAMTTASTSGDPATSRQSRTTCRMPNSDAASDAFAASLDQTRASSTSSMAASRGRCLARATPPAPIKPTLTLSNLASCQPWAAKGPSPMRIPPYPNFPLCALRALCGEKLPLSLSSENVSVSVQ